MIIHHQIGANRVGTKYITLGYGAAWMSLGIVVSFIDLGAAAGAFTPNLNLGAAAGKRDPNVSLGAAAGKRDPNLDLAGSWKADE